MLRICYFWWLLARRLKISNFCMYSKGLPEFQLIIIMGKSDQHKGKIAAFIRKLVIMLQDEKFQSFISWLAQDGGFQITNVSQFVEQVLPTYFKHKNLSSFIRQLNLYGFIRPKESDQYVYCHPRFKKGNRNSWRFITRHEGSKAQKKEIQEDSGSDYQIQSFENNKSLQTYESLLKENEELKKTNEALQQKLSNLTKKLRHDQESQSQKMPQTQNDSRIIQKEIMSPQPTVPIQNNANNQGYFQNMFFSYLNYIDQLNQINHHVDESELESKRAGYKALY